MKTVNTSEDKYPQLMQREIPRLSQDQLDYFTYDNIHPTKAGGFNTERTLELLKEKDGSKALGVDVGGDKALFQSFVVSPEGGLDTDDAYHDLRKDGQGAGYMEGIEEVADFASENNLPVGISIGLPLEGSKPEDGDKLSTLINDLRTKYGGDFANMHFPKLACLNDAPAGLISGAIHSSLILGQNIDTVIYLINGGGIGAAVLKDGKITATEAGHVKAVDELNLYKDERKCGLFGNEDPCLELVAANKVGIEKVWQDKTGSRLNALEIEQRFTGGQPDGELVLELYDHSAFVLAHIAKGLAKVFDIDLSNPSVAIVGHGGAFKFPNYGNRIRQILAANGVETSIVLTKDFSSNACAEGAAIAALTI